MSIKQTGLKCLLRHRVLGTLDAPPAGLLFKDLVLGQEYLIQLYANKYYLILSSPGYNCRSIPGQIPAVLLIIK